MRLLPDTHLLLWAAEGSSKLSLVARSLIEDPANQIHFSAVSIWETAIKHARHRPDFRVPPKELEQGCIASGFHELQVTSDHAIAVTDLPMLHRDPFDRLLAAQAEVEGLVLITADTTLARYPGVRLV